LMPSDPTMMIQKKEKVVGTRKAPKMSWRIVRPREMRAMNIPTKADQEIHHPQ